VSEKAVGAHPAGACRSVYPAEERLTVKRWLSIFAAAASFVLFVAVVVLWVRSYRTIDSFAWTSRGGNSREVGSFAGTVFVDEWQRITEGSDLLDLFGWNGRRGSAPSPFTRGSRWSDRYSPSAMYWTVFGFGVVADGSLVSTIERVERQGGRIMVSGEVKSVQRNQMTLVVPHWLLAVATAVLPLRAGLLLWRSRRSRRCRAGGLCGRCGYDLRASPGQCPECGTTADAPAA
jgi:hypothetical protein